MERDEFEKHLIQLDALEQDYNSVSLEKQDLLE